jgi:hypothetical protein
MKHDIPTPHKRDIFITLERSFVMSRLETPVRASVTAQVRDDRRTISVLLGLWGLLGLLAACAPDYVYIQDGKSEQDVRRDYISCAEQQFKVSNSTTECMERQGYRATKIEEASRSDEQTRPVPDARAFLP